MWVLHSLKDPGEKFHLLVDQEYVVGRKDCPILILGDQSLSRKHAVITVVHPENNLPYPHKPPQVTLTDCSKFGTFVNGVKVNGQTQIKDNDELRFGTLQSKFKLFYEPFVITTSCLDPTSKKDVKTVTHVLGGHNTADWRKDCTLLVMNNLSVTIKVICALISQKPIVTPMYLKELRASLENKTHQPDIDNYLPPLAESQLNPDEVSFKRNPSRRTLFKGRKIIFLSPKQFKKLSLPVELAGGTPILMEEGSDDNNDSVLVRPGTCVMYCDPSESTQQLSQNAQEWRQHVVNYLKAHDRRMIQDAELGYAVLYCSTEKYFNAHQEAGKNLLHITSQSLSQAVDPFSQIGTEHTARNGTQGMSSSGRPKINQPVTKFSISGQKKKEPSKNHSQVSHSNLASETQSEEHAAKGKKRIRSFDEVESSTSKVIKTEVPDSLDFRQHAISKKPANKPQEEVTACTIKQEMITPARPSHKLPTEETNFETEDNFTDNYISSEKFKETSKDKCNNNDTHGTKTTAVFSNKDIKVENEERNNENGHFHDSVITKNRNKQQQMDKKNDGERKAMSENSVSRDDRDLMDKDNRMKRRDLEAMDEIGDASDNFGNVPDGYLNAQYPVRENGNIKTEIDPDLPVKVMQVEFVSMVARKPNLGRMANAKRAGNMWKGKPVKNFKKFKKNGPDIHGIPRIIGGSDLVVHSSEARRELDEWFREELQAESQETEKERMADEFFTIGSVATKPRRKR